LHIIDPTVPVVTRSLCAETNGSAVAAFGDRVYFVDPHEIIVSLATRTGVESTLGHLPDVYRGHLPWPFSLAVSPRGDRLVVAHSGVTAPGNVAEVGTFWLSVLEPRTGALLSRIPPRHEHTKTRETAACLVSQLLISPEGDRLYELCLWGGSYPLRPDVLVRTVDLVKGAFLGPLKLPESQARVSVLAPDGARLYVLTQQAHLLVVETEGLTISETLVLSDLGGPPSARYGARLVIAPDGKQFYLTSGQNDNKLYASGSAVGRPGRSADLTNGTDGWRTWRSARTGSACTCFPRLS
jgi:hypothetical protein